MEAGGFFLRWSEPMPRTMIASLTGCMIVGIAVTVTSAAGSNPSQDSAGQPDQPTAEVEGLVMQLGAQTYAARQQASLKLARIGMPAREALVAALGSSDAEVRSRSRRLLARIVEDDFQFRLQEFAADTGGNSDHGLPLWKEFRTVVGDTATARKWFVAMQRAEPILLEVASGEKQRLVDVYALRLRQTLDRGDLDYDSPQPAIDPGSTLTLLFLGGDPASGISGDLRRAADAMFYSRSFYGQMDEPVFRKLASRWVAGSPVDEGAWQDLEIAHHYRLPEGLALAVKVLRADSNLSPPTVQWSLLTVGLHGRPEHLPLVEKYLDETSTLPSPAAEDVQTGDVALLACVRLTGQRLRDYGLAIEEAEVDGPRDIRFRSEADRQRAHALWKTWSQLQDKPAEKQSPSE